MKVVLDIKDSKADFFMELVNNLGFVKKLKQKKSQLKNKFYRS